MHLALSVGLGALLVAIARWWRLHGGMLVVAAIALITVETPLVLRGFLHTILPATTFHYYLAAIPLWGSVLGHYLYALVLGLLLAIQPVFAAKKAKQPSLA
jgi:hypothetical protein